MAGSSDICDPWIEYLDWNTAIATVLYGREAAGRPAFLDLEEMILEKVAVEAGRFVSNARQGLLAAVRPTLNAPTHSAGIFGMHRARLMRWQVESGEPPPTVALLAVLSLAAEDMHGGDGFVAHDYYNRLMPLLDVDNEEGKERVIRSYRECSHLLWDSLNGWLEDLDGERGLPTAFALGYRHVGLPISQAILRTTDREKLREFFTEFGFAPRSRLSPRDMGALLGEWIGRTPSPASNAMQVLWKRKGARDQIIEGSCALVETWDGPSIDRAGEDTMRAGSRFADIRLTALLRTFPVAEARTQLHRSSELVGGRDRDRRSP